MLEGIITGIIIAIASILINALVRRTGVQTRTDRLEKEVEDLKRGQIAILEVLRPLIVALQGGKPNGELEQASRRLDEYLIKK